MNQLGIDVYTKDINYVINRLKRLKTTISVTNGGKYYADSNYSQIHLTTTWTENDLDDWLYRTDKINYVGTFTREYNP